MLSNACPIGSEDIETLSACPICDSNLLTSVTSVFTLDSNHKKKYINFFETSVCNRCGLIFRNIRPSRAWFEDIWSSRQKNLSDRTHAANIYEEKDLYIYSASEQNSYKRYLNIYRAISKLGISSGRVLDIGSGPGGGLLAFRDKGWDVMGLEAEPLRAQYCESVNKIPVIRGTIENADLPEASFDLVILSHSLEHFHKPIEALKKARKLVSQNGYIYVEVPNVLNYVKWLDAFNLSHMSNFNYDNLIYSLVRTGFIPLMKGMPKTEPFGVKNLGVISKLSNSQEDQTEFFSVVDTEEIRELSLLYLAKAPYLIHKTVCDMQSKSINCSPVKISYIIPFLEKVTSAYPESKYLLNLQKYPDINELIVKFLPSTTWNEIRNLNPGRKLIQKLLSFKRKIINRKTINTNQLEDRKPTNQQEDSEFELSDFFEI
jgi:SAM-dependent methyltransferase